MKKVADEVFGEDNFVNEIMWGYKDIGAKAVPYRCAGGKNLSDRGVCRYRALPHDAKTQCQKTGV